MRACRRGPVLIVALLVFVWASPARAQSFIWWRAEQVQKDLGMTSDQSDRIERVFQVSLPQLKKTKEELDRQEEDLSRLIEGNAEEPLVGRVVDKVEATRGSLNKMRTLMLLRMRQVLTPEQRGKLKVLRDQWQRDHPGQTSGGRKPQ